jgi:hypothetical protein
MKVKLFFTLLLCLFLALGLGGTAFAQFHNGGVADCAGCHSMHATYGIDQANSSTGAPGSTTGGSPLLMGSDQSSTCLYCHASNSPTLSGGTTAGMGTPIVMTYPSTTLTNGLPVQRTPGGDFGWLNYAYLNTSANFQANHGHNVIAADYRMGNNSGYATAPANPAGSGSFSGLSLYCNACHDPHNRMRRDGNGAIQNLRTFAGGPLPIIGSGSYPSSVPGVTGAVPGVTSPSGANQAVGVYRLLAGYNTYTANGATIPYSGVPVAIAPAIFNQVEYPNQVRVAYGDGTMITAAGPSAITWGVWCSTCHTGFNSSTGITGASRHLHPVDTAVPSTYNNYIGSANLGGNQSTSFLSLVPIIEGSQTTWLGLAGFADSTGTQIFGSQNGDEVSCLSCHRAHASGFPNALRWDTLDTFITNAGGWNPGTTTTIGLQNALDAQAAYYGRAVTATGPGDGRTTFALYQRSLCNKCHGQD